MAGDVRRIPDEESVERGSTGPEIDIGKPKHERSDPIRDSIAWTTQEKSRISNALILASLEGIRLSADIVGSFAEEVLQHNQRRTEAESASVKQGLPRDVYRGIVRAIDESLDIPSETLDKFFEVYRKA